MKILKQITLSIFFLNICIYSFSQETYEKSGTWVLGEKYNKEEAIREGINMLKERIIAEVFGSCEFSIGHLKTDEAKKKFDIYKKEKYSVLGGMVTYSYEDNNIVWDGTKLTMKVVFKVKDKKKWDDLNQELCAELIRLKALEDEHQPQNKFELFKYINMMGVGSILYDVKNSGINISLCNLFVGFDKRKIFGFGFNLLKVARLKNMNYEITNYGDWSDLKLFSNYDRYSNGTGKFSIDPSMVNKNNGSFNDPFNIFSFFNTKFQINLITIPGFVNKDKFDIKNFVLSAYIEAYPIEFIPIEVPYKSFNSRKRINSVFSLEDKQERIIKDENTYSYSWNFFNSWEVGIKLQSSLFYVSCGFFKRDSGKSKRIIQNILVIEEDKSYKVKKIDAGGKKIDLVNYQLFFVKVGLTFDFWDKNKEIF